MDIKRSVSKISFLFICFVVTLLFIGTCVLITTLAFGVNPFKSGTSGLLSFSFFSLLGMSVVALMVNVAANLSLIAEEKNKEVQRVASKSIDGKKVLRIWGAVTVGLSAIIIATIVVLDSGSEKMKFKFVEEMSSEVLTQSAKLIDKIAADLKSNDLARLAEIPKKLDFIRRQKQDLPELLMIYSEDFEGQVAYRVINSWNLSPLLQEQKYPFYSCTQDIDCEQIKTFFETGNLKSFSVKQKGLDEYSVYYPFELNGARFILMFNKGMRFGSVGKYE